MEERVDARAPDTQAVISTEQALARLGEGWRLLKARQTRAAREAFEVARVRDAFKAEALAGLAEAAFAEQRVEEAKTLVERAISEGGGVAALLAQAKVRRTFGDLRGARESCRAVLALEPRNAEARRQLATLSRARRR